MEIKTKYSIDDKVYFLYQNNINNSTVEAIDIRMVRKERDNKPISIKYVIKASVPTCQMSQNEAENGIDESKLFSSKEDLLKSL